MDSLEKWLEKLNAKGTLTLADIMSLSSAQLRKLTDSRLTPQEAEILIKRIQQIYKDNIVFESRLLSRANPQLSQLAHLDINPLQGARVYAEMFPRRADNFVTPGSVSSLFSPAAYLTELYREASPLYSESSVYNLKKRRPDLGTLQLSQANMDCEISTLSLSNEILLNNIREHQLWSVDKVIETLSSYRLSSDTPYHAPYSAIRQSILLQDPDLSALAHTPYFSAQLPKQLLMALEMDISPDLLAILTEEITESNAAARYEKNFGNRPIDYFSSVGNLAHFYDLSTNEIAAFIGSVSTTFRGNSTDDQWIDYTQEPSGIVLGWRIKRTKADNYDNELHYIELHRSLQNTFFVRVNYKKDAGMAVIQLEKPKKLILAKIAEKDGNSYQNIEYCSNSFTLDEDTLKAEFEIKSNRYKINDSRSIQASTQAIFSIEPAELTLFLLQFNKLVRLYKASGLSLLEMERILLHADGQTFFNENLLTNLAYAKYLCRQYGISSDEALMLCDLDISRTSTAILSSQFDLLFNSPPLNGQTFFLDGKAILINPSKLDPADSLRRAVLKRAFQVDDRGLWLLHQMGCRTMSDSVNNNLDCLSGLYRIALLAQVHALTVDELNTLLLLSLSPYRTTPLYNIDAPTLKSLTQYLFFITEWLAKQTWSVYQLFIMVTDSYSEVWTPSLDDLRQTLLDIILHIRYTIYH